MTALDRLIKSMKAKPDIAKEARCIFETRLGIMVNDSRVDQTAAQQVALNEARNFLERATVGEGE